MFRRLPGLRSPSPSIYTPRYNGADAVLELTYLGTAGFVLQTRNRTLVLDPFVTRPSLADTLARPLCPDRTLIRRHIPHADDVLVGHAHYDHVLDAPDLCQLTGARLIGSGTVCMVGRAAGLPEHQIRATAGRETIACGDCRVRGLPSRHGKAVLGRIPFPGDLQAPPPWPPRVHQLPHGPVLNWWLDTGALRVLHIDSADFVNSELADLQADLVCLCAIGRHYRPNYVRDIVRLVRPRWIVPCHWDTMITPLTTSPQYLPGVDLPGFIAEIQAAGVTPVVLPLGGRQGFPAP